MGPIWGRQGPGGAHVGPLKFTFWETPKLSIFACNEHDHNIMIENFDVWDGITYLFLNFNGCTVEV